MRKPFPGLYFSPTANATTVLYNQPISSGINYILYDKLSSVHTGSIEISLDQRFYALGGGLELPEVTSEEVLPASFDVPLASLADVLKTCERESRNKLEIINH